MSKESRTYRLDEENIKFLNRFNSGDKSFVVNRALVFYRNYVIKEKSVSGVSSLSDSKLDARIDNLDDIRG